MARIADFDALSRQSANLSGRLYDQVVSSRMRPFGDATPGLARLVRDLARQLGKQARLEIVGRATEVDREILEQLDAPLTHLLRNAVDHGLEPPDERAAAGKPAEGRIDVEAGHVGGMLLVRVRDDGRGIDPAAVRRRVVERGLASAEIAARLSEAELFEFLLLPGFSTRDAVSEISGRGVGLDAVQAMVQAAGGALRIASTTGPRHGVRAAAAGDPLGAARAGRRDRRRALRRPAGARRARAARRSRGAAHGRGAAVRRRSTATIRVAWCRRARC